MRAGFFTEVYHPVVNGIVASVEERDEPVFRMPSLPLPVQAPYRLTLPLVSRRNRHAIINRLDILHAHSPFVTGWMAVRYARRLRVPLVYTYHTQLEEYAHYVPFEPHATRRAASTLTRSFANLADAVIVPTASMRDHLSDIGVTVRIDIIPSGIDLQRFGAGMRRPELRQSLGVRGGERLLLFVSRLAREKNGELLIDAVKASKVPVHLVIAGDGPERSALEARAAQLGVADRTRFLGNVQRDALPDLYASADAFVFPSVTETQGLVLVEALAAGALVIAADAPPVREVLAGAGRLVEPAAGAFARAFEDVPLAPEPQAAAMACAAAARYGVERQAAGVATLYEDLTRTYVRYTMRS
jgi:glycosyltransferase involved in cell wall biosynthesis